MRLIAGEGLCLAVSTISKPQGLLRKTLRVVSVVRSSSKDPEGSVGGGVFFERPGGWLIRVCPLKHLRRSEKPCVAENFPERSKAGQSCCLTGFRSSGRDRMT